MLVGDFGPQRAVDKILPALVAGALVTEFVSAIPTDASVCGIGFAAHAAPPLERRKQP